MALVASALIKAAKARTFGLLRTQKVSNSMLLEELSYQDQIVMQMLSQNTPDLLTNVTGVLAVSDTGNANGYSLREGMHYRDFVHADVDNDIRPLPD